MFLVNSIWSDQHGGGSQERDSIMKDMNFEELETAMKVVIVGNGSVGKSSMIQRFCRGIFTRDYKKTIGVDFLERLLTVDDHSIRLMLWDTAGQEEFDAITRTYYRGANACVLACSVTDKESFLALPKWKTKVSRECGDIPMVLVANKMDLQKQAVVDSMELEKMAKELGISKIYKTSVKEDLNVTAVFSHLAQCYIQSVISLNAEDEHDEEYLLPLQDEDNSQHNIHHNSSYPLFGNNNKTKSKNKLLNGSNHHHHQNQHNNHHHSNGNSNNKGIFKSPVILKSSSGGGGGGGVGGHLHMQNGSNNLSHHNHNRGFFSSAKNKLLLSQNNQVRKNNQANNNGIPSYTFGNGNSHGPRWNDTGKYDNMPFRLDLVKAKKRRRELCNIL